MYLHMELSRKSHCFEKDVHPYLEKDVSTVIIPDIVIVPCMDKDSICPCVEWWREDPVIVP